MINNLNHLRFFIAVYEHRNMTKAARTVKSSTSQVSQVIKELSAQMGVSLFERSEDQKGVEPTVHAVEYYKEIKDAVGLITGGFEHVRELNKDSRACIRFFAPPLTLNMIGEYLKQFRKKFPKMTLEVISYADTPLFSTMDYSYEAIRQQKVDFIIDRDCTCERHSFNIIALIEPQFILIASKKFLSEYNLCTTITKEQFAKLPLLCASDIDNLFTNKGIEVSPYIRKTNYTEIYEMVCNGVGIGLHFREVVDRCWKNDDIVEITVQGVFLPKFRLVCGYKTYLTKAARIFIDGMVNYLKTDLN